MIAALLMLSAIGLAIPGLALLLLVLAARRSPPEVPALPVRRPRVTVLVPAHNESFHLVPTIENLRGELDAGDRLLVVADNCVDDTADCARAAGADVVERFDSERRGKGYALAFGVAQLHDDPPDVLVIVDADCRLSRDGLAHMAGLAARSGRPVQILNLMRSAPQAPVRFRMLEFAMRLKNLVRPLGMMVLGDSCHLTGTGMAIPWALARSAQFATGHIAEDMKLGIEMARQGTPPLFTRLARIGSEFVQDTAVVKTQKTRWEHGHLQTIGEELPGLVRAALQERRRSLMVMALDLVVPPLALYAAVAASGALALGTVAWLVNTPTLALSAAAIAGMPLLFAILLAWWGFGRDLLTGRELLTAPLYVAWKLPVYLAYALRRRSAWVRTRR